LKGKIVLQEQAIAGWLDAHYKRRAPFPPSCIETKRLIREAVTLRYHKFVDLEITGVRHLLAQPIHLTNTCLLLVTLRDYRHVHSPDAMAKEFASSHDDTG
jgi:hypothetical protein